LKVEKYLSRVGVKRNIECDISDWRRDILIVTFHQAAKKVVEIYTKSGKKGIIPWQLMQKTTLN
jgi:hypothetical protein